MGFWDGDDLVFEPKVAYLGLGIAHKSDDRRTSLSMPAAPGLPRGRILLGPDSITTSPSRNVGSDFEDDDEDPELSGSVRRYDCELIHPPVLLAESMSVIFVDGRRMDRRYAVVRPVRPAPRTVTFDGGTMCG